MDQLTEDINVFISLLIIFLYNQYSNKVILVHGRVFLKLNQYIVA